ncbi:cupin domain-containing protein [Niabella ginsengisoli]|uniref:Cupin domain-containing protein n=1 Tax=Niabella ginsengisoli TaxID=522298 RepID=A0ABS9SKK3_9BACT|nr:cupin domain-containing protein [Niabella ginsengisoli]MCH5598893.1 cupin domain-containing protein [Niabella ginsengisoli]
MKNILATSLFSSLLFTLIGCQSGKTGGEVNHEDSLKGITSEVLKTVNIADVVIPEGNKPLECRSMRLRLFTLTPGGEIGLHSHENRPAILSAVKGVGMDVFAFSENETEANTPVTLKYGESYAKPGAIHYAINLSKTDTLNLITFDLLDNGSECNGVKYPQNTPVLERIKKENHPFYAKAPKSEEDEFSLPIFDVPVSTITFKEGKAGLKNRMLRTRKITLDGGASIPSQNYENRPSYIFVMEGSVNVKNENAAAETLQPFGTTKLINAGNVAIGNASATEKSVYIIMEIWDPADKDII